MNTLESQVMRNLVHQVSKASKGRSEREVTTIITRPLWRLWLKAVGDPVDSEPTEWIGEKETRRVYGSKTIVVDRDCFESVSFAT